MPVVAGFSADLPSIEFDDHTDVEVSSVLVGLDSFDYPDIAFASDFFELDVGWFAELSCIALRASLLSNRSPVWGISATKSSERSSYSNSGDLKALASNIDSRICRLLVGDVIFVLLLLPTP